MKAGPSSIPPAQKPHGCMAREEEKICREAGPDCLHTLNTAQDEKIPGGEPGDFIRALPQLPGLGGAAVSISWCLLAQHSEGHCGASSHTATWLWLLAQDPHKCPWHGDRHLAAGMNQGTALGTNPKACFCPFSLVTGGLGCCLPQPVRAQDRLGGHCSATSIPPTWDRGKRGAPGTKLSSFTSRMNHARCKHPTELLLASVTKNTLCQALCFAVRGSLASACLWLYPCPHLTAGSAVCPIPSWQLREAALARGRRSGRQGWQRSQPRQAEGKAVCLRSWKI